MTKYLMIKELEVSSFKGLGITQVDLNKKEIFIVGRNASGKSSLLDSIAWILFDCDRFGANIAPIQKNAITVRGKLSYVTDNNFNLSATRIHQFAQKTTRTSNGLINCPKKVFVALTNPLYAIGQTPATLKELLVACSPFDGNTLSKEIGDFWLDTARTYSLGGLSSPISEIYSLIDEKISEFNKLKKARTQDIDTCQIQLLTLETFSKYSLSSSLEAEYLKTKKQIEELLKTNQEKEGMIDNALEELKSLKNLIANAVTQSFSSFLDKLNIRLFDETGKENFFVTYNDTNVRTLSNSEYVKAGLEFCNALMAWMDVSYPVLIDNGEAIRSLDLEDYPNISQIIATMVCDENLSTWESGILTDVVSKVPMPRTKNEILPEINILCDWNSVRPSKEVALS